MLLCFFKRREVGYGEQESGHFEVFWIQKGSRDFKWTDNVKDRETRRVDSLSS